ncbi:unnamed protein product [Auanema sp. JU1783]|nr:unnamed protein product [Auanema sp. JU1783]
MGAYYVNCFLFLLLTCLACVEGSKEPPIIVEHPIDVIVPKGAPATLNCAARGVNVSFTWYRNGERVITNKDQAHSHRILLDSGSLFLLKTNIGKNNKDGDAGNYFCKAKNNFGEAKSNEGSLKIAMLGDEFRVRPRTTMSLAGSRAILECSSPLGFPEPVVSWRKNEKEFSLNDNARATLDPTGNLIFSPVEYSDSGTYQCVSINMVGERVSSPARLSVYEKPQFIKKPEDVTSELGGSILFNCTVGGEPQPQVYWTKKGDQMPVARAFIARDNKGLRIENIQKSDEGEYVCHARNPTGSIETSARLRVQVLPSFEISPISQEVMLGGQAVFHCVPNGQPAPASFWSKSGDQNMFFPGYVSADSRVSVQHNGTLIIKNIKSEDGGSYTCAAMNSAGSALSKAKLTVLNSAQPINFPPIIEKLPQNQTVAVGMRMKMKCTTKSETNGMAVWEHNGKEIDMTRLGLRQIDDGSLIINSVKSEDQGVYTCTLTSAGGRTQFSSILKVEEKGDFKETKVIGDLETTLYEPGKPVLVEVTDSEIELEWTPPTVNETAVLSYTIEYYSPQSNKTWITLSEFIKGTKFRAKNLKPSSEYVFFVRARSENGLGLPSLLSSTIKTKEVLGDISATDIENINTRLSSEQIINLKEARTLNATAIHLFWTVRKYRDIVDGFYVKWRGPSQNNSQRSVLIRGANDNDCIVNELQAFTNYKFFIIPFKGSVQGVPSNSMEGLTAEAAPSLPPLEVRVRMLNLTSVRVSWKPPPLEGLNGILKGFQIEIVGEGNKYNRNISTKERAASVTLFHLTPLMTYRISVAARTNAGIGVFHPVEIIKMNTETLEQHRELYGETSSPILALLRQPWFLVLLTVLGWIVLIAIAVFLFMRYKRNSSGIKKRNGSFIKINDGSIHVGQNTLWDQGGTVHLGRLPPGNRTIMSQPFISGSPAGREMHEYAMGGQDGVYHYAQAPGDNYSSKFQDDPSPYATTTIVMSNDSAAFRNDGTILRPPPSNTIPHNPPFGIETEIERINDKYIERATNRRRNNPSPPQNPSYGHRLKNTIGSTLPRSPPKQTLFDFIPPPPMNPPPLLNNIAADRYEEARRAADGAISRTAAARLQKSKNADELSQRSSLLSDEDEELQSLHDGPLTSTHKKMPRMGISATFLNSND